MRLSRLVLASLLVICLGLTGCGSKNNNSGNAQIRVVNAFPEASALNVSVGGTAIATGLAFQGLAPYASANSGSQTFTVSVAGTTTTLINATNSPNSNNNYTYIIFGPLTAVGAILANDSFNDPGNGLFAVRAINAAAGAGTIDVYITAPGADLTATAPSVASVAYGASSSFSSVAIGSNFEIRITPAGTKDVIYDFVPRTFAEHSATDVVVFGKGSGKLVNVALLNHDTAGSGVVADNLLAQYKVINASLVGSPLNAFVDGSLQLSNIPYTGVSNYQRTAAGTHNFSIEATTTPGAQLLAIAQTLAPATDTSIALNGTAGALKGLVLNDDNLPPPSGTAGVRLVNTVADGTAFDVFVNFSKQISALAQNTASAYVDLNAAASVGTPYEFDFNVAGTTTAVLKLPSVVLTAGHKYTIYIAGSGTALQGIVTQDN